MAALGVFLLLVAATGPACLAMEGLWLRDLLAEPMNPKNQGEFLQREAFKRSDVLPLYGSSELTVPMANRGSEFFRHAPTGFQVCPVGGGGNTTLLMAEKFAALGDAMRGHKVALILSSSWFRRKEVPEEHVAGNFSPLQAITMLRNPDFDPALRHRLVERMKQCPPGLEPHPILAAYLNHVDQGGWRNTLTVTLLKPLLDLIHAQLTWQDHLAMATAAIGLGHKEGINWHVEPRTVEWDQLLQQMEEGDAKDDEQNKTVTERTTGGDEDELYVSEMRAAKEWDDFALMLDTLDFLKADVLVISVPLPGFYCDPHGISRAARDYYYHRVEEMTAARTVRRCTLGSSNAPSTPPLRGLRRSDS